MSRPAVWLLGLLSLLVLTLLCVAVSAPRIQSDLTERSRTALAEAGLGEVASVAFDGRDAVLRTLDDEAYARAEPVVAGVEGVRVVRAWRGQQAVPDDTSDTGDPARGAGVESDRGATDEGVVFALGAEPSGAPGAAPAGLAVRARVPSEAARERLLERLRGAFPGRTLRDGIEVQPGADSSWAETLPDLLPALAPVEGLRLRLRGGREGAVSIRGTVPTEAARQAVLREAAAAIAPRRVQDRLSVDEAPTEPGTTDTGGGGRVVPSQPQTQPRAASPDTPGAQPLPPAMSGSTEVQNNLPNDPEMVAAAAALERAVRVGAVTFASSSTTLTPQGERVLARAADVLKATPSAVIELQAHTDSEGPTSSNQRLSERRAVAAKAYLVEQGVEWAQIKAAGYGESTPIADNDTEAGRERNRRVVFKILERR